MARTCSHMVECWNENPAVRPSGRLLKKQLLKIEPPRPEMDYRIHAMTID